MQDKDQTPDCGIQGPPPADADEPFQALPNMNVGCLPPWALLQSLNASGDWLL